MENSDTQGITALRPVKKHRTSTTGSDKVITMGGIINPIHKEVIIISIQITI